MSFLFWDPAQGSVLLLVLMVTQAFLCSDGLPDFTYCLPFWWPMPRTVPVTHRVLKSICWVCENELVTAWVKKSKWVVYYLAFVLHYAIYKMHSLILFILPVTLWGGTGDEYYASWDLRFWEVSELSLEKKSWDGTRSSLRILFFLPPQRNGTT